MVFWKASRASEKPHTWWLQSWGRCCRNGLERFGTVPEHIRRVPEHCNPVPWRTRRAGSCPRSPRMRWRGGSSVWRSNQAWAAALPSRACHRLWIERAGARQGNGTANKQCDSDSLHFVRKCLPPGTAPYTELLSAASLAMLTERELRVLNIMHAYIKKDSWHCFELPVL